MVSRKQVEERILQIISYIDQEKTIKPLVWSLKLFSLEELLQLQEFLETGDYKPIYLLVDKKIKEYLEVMQKLKQIQVWKKMKEIKKQEQQEYKQEQFNLNLALA